MLNLGDLYGAEYLNAMRPGPETVVLPDPENDFNRGQDFEGRKAFDGFVRAAMNPSQDLERSARLGASLGGMGGHGPTVSGHKPAPVRLRKVRRSVVVELVAGMSMAGLRASQPGLTPRPMRRLWTAWLRTQAFDMQGTLGLLAAGHRVVDVMAFDKLTGAPLQGAFVQLVYSQAQHLGVEVYTDAAGRARILIPALYSAAEALTVQPLHSYWPATVLNPSLAGPTITVQLHSIASHPKDTLRSILAPGSLASGKGVKVAIIDGGVGPHADLVVAGGANLVPFEDPIDVGSHLDNGFGHGTHVAGIVAGKGLIDSKFPGLAPGAELYSYRVMAKGMRSADDIAVADALEMAIEQGCHVINLSLGGTVASREVGDAVLKALAGGAAVIAAVGNGGRQPVEFPASLPGVIAVTALGDVTLAPPGSTSAAAAVAPFLPGPGCPQAFIANFSNMGPEVDLAAPGVGVISTYPGDTYAVSDGTSMAAPAITGLAARVLSQNARVLGMPPSQARADAITHLTITTAQKLGFGPHLEGEGLRT